MLIVSEKRLATGRSELCGCGWVPFPCGDLSNGPSSFAGVFGATAKVSNQTKQTDTAYRTNVTLFKMNSFRLHPILKNCGSPETIKMVHNSVCLSPCSMDHLSVFDFIASQQHRYHVKGLRSINRGPPPRMRRVGAKSWIPQMVIIAQIQ